MISVRTRDAAGTEALGAALAGLLRPGDVVLLLGGLGAGKTTLVQGIARGLGCGEGVTSPTFTICHTYRGRLELVHADLWRLEHTSELLDLALEEELERGAVVVVEWGEGAEAVFGADALVVELAPGGAEDEREVTVEARGRWSERAGGLAEALQAAA